MNNNGLEQLPRSVKISYLKAIARREIKPKHFYDQVIICNADGTTRDGGEPIEDALKNMPPDLYTIQLPYNGREVVKEDPAG